MIQRNKKRGFTLIELMVVIVILGIIATMAFVFVLDKPDETRWTTAQSEMAEITKALNDYALNHDGDYPDSLEVLTEKHFPNGVPKDPFTKEDYLYETTDTGFTLTCLGKDLAEGGAEKPNKDIVYNEAGLIKDEG
jgi:general secretion pathway protein G